MPDTQRTQTDPKAQLFDQLDSIKVGLLGVNGADSFPQPMTHFAEPKTGRVWFITSRKTDLAKEIGQGATATYCVAEPKDGYYAALRGTILPSEDSGKLDELWGMVSSAWFTGRDDPDILLVELTLRDGEVWSSTSSTLHFGFEIAKANLDSDAKPDVGARNIIRF